MTNPAFRTAIRRGTLAAAFIVIAVALGGAGFWYYQAQAKAIHQNSYETIAAISKMKVGQIVQWQKERLIDVTREANSPTLIKGLGMIARNAETPEIRDQALEILKLSKKQDEYSNIIALSPSGQVLFSTGDGPVSMGEATQRAVEAARANPSGAISDFFRTSEGEVDIDAVAAARDAGGSVLGFIVIRCRAAIYLYPLIQSWPMPSRSAEALLVERDEENVVFLNELRHCSKTPLSFRHSLKETNRPSVQAALGRHGMFDGKDYRNVEVLADLSSIPGTPWFIVAKVDREEIMAEAGYRAASTGIIVGAIILLISLAGAFVYTWRHAKLLRKLLELERYQRQQQILSSQLAAIVESSDDAIIGKNLDGIITSWNRGAEKLFGYEASEMVGTSIMRLIPEDRQDEETLILEKIRRGDSWEHFVTVRHAKDGRLIDVSITASPIKDAAGRIIGVSKIARDITEAKKIENTLRESAMRFSTLADSGRALIWTSGIDKKCNYFNRVWLAFTGRTLEQELGDGWAEGVHPDDLDSCFRTYVEAFDLHTPFSMDYRLRRHDGEYRWLQDEGTPRYSSEGEFLGYIGHCLDFTDRKKAEVATLQHQLIAKHARDPLLLMEVDGKILESNPAAEALYGYSHEELLQLNILDLRIHADPEVVSQQIEQALTLGLLFETVHYCKDGSPVPVEVSSRGIVVDGKTMLSSVIRDITQRKKEEETLRKSDERMRHFFEHQTVGMAITSPDKRWLEVNDRLCQMLGYTREELMQLTWEQLTHPDDREDNSTLFEKLLSGEIDNCNFEKRYIRKDGGVIYAMASIDCIRLHDGRLDYVLLLVIDITEGYQVQQKLRLQGSALEAAANAIVITDSKGVIEWVNTAFTTFTGYTTKEAVGNTTNLLKSGKQDQAFYKKLWKTILAGEVWHGELINRRKDGTLYPEEMTITPIKNEDGKIAHFIAVKQDVTKRKQNEQSLLDAHAQLEQRVKDRTSDLNRSKNQLQLVLNSTAEAIYGIDMEGECTFCNSACLQMLGYEHEDELLGKNMHWQIHQKYPDGTHFPVEDCRIFWAFQKHEGSHVDDEVLWRADGTSFPAEYWSYPQQIDGVVVGAVVTFIDITERQLAQKRFELMFRNNPVMMVLSSMPDRRFSDVNDSFLKSLGYSRDDVIGKTAGEIGIIPNEKHLTEVADKLQEFGKITDTELQFRRKDGTMGDGIFSGEVIRSQGNWQLLTVMTDISGRKQAEESLAKSAERLFLATSAGGVGVWDYDLIDNILTWDEQMFALYGITRESFGGAYEAWKAGLHPDDVERGDNEIQMALSGERDFDTEFRVVWPGGTVREIRALALVKRDASGQPVRMIGTNWDITERKRIEIGRAHV